MMFLKKIRKEESLISALLDPRIKFLGFINEEVRKKKNDQLKANSLLTTPTNIGIIVQPISSIFNF